MKDKDRVARIIRATRPRAKFTVITHSSEFIEPLAFLGDGYFYVNLYDEKIDSVLNNIKNGPVYLIHNTYLSSFAYNLFLSWIYKNTNSETTNSIHSETARLLKHNFKKFFAEQLLSYNNIFSRAVFLETLLYEQKLMVPLFKATESDENLQKKAEFSADLMSSIVSFHELGHFFLNKSSQVWDELINENAATLKILYSKIENNYSSLFLEEFKCDAISIFCCISQFRNEEVLSILLKSLAFGFSSFATMMSLVKSANATSNEHKKIKEEVVFHSIEKTHRDYNYKIGRDLDFIERARLAVELCRIIAEENGFDLFNVDDGFPLPKSIIEDLLAFIDLVMESDDENARSMSMLAAESLHNHPDGIEYLYLKSKVFRSKRKLTI